MNAHTPGPWHVDECPDADGFFTIRPPADIDAQPIATVYTGADAALIAAAPDLLAALRDVVAYWDMGGFEGPVAHPAGAHEYIVAARAALAQVRS